MDSGKLRASEGRDVGEWDRLVMCIKEGMYSMVLCVLYASNESGTLHQKLGVYCMVTNMI